MELEERVWDAFTDLDEEEMADVAERATDVRVFRSEMLEEVLDEFHVTKGNRDFIIRMAERENDFCINDKWMAFSDLSEGLYSSCDLMELLTEMEDDIVFGIINDYELMAELGIEEVE